MTPKEHILSYLRFETEEMPTTPIYFTVPVPYVTTADYPLCERSVFKDGYDAYGVHWTAAVPTSHVTPGQPEIIDDIEEWEDQLKLPDLDTLDWDYVTEFSKGVDKENNVISLTMNIGPFERTTMLSTFEDCLVNAISEPELFSDLISKLADFRIDILRRTNERMKIDVVNFHDDWGTNKGPMMSPELWRQVIKPHTKRMYDAAKEMGIIICQHSCGNLMELVDEIVDMGANAWEAQPDVQDVPALREKFAGRLRILPTMPLQEPPKEETESEEILSPPQVQLRQITGYDEKPEWLL